DPVRVGGISRTVDYKGFLFDIGGHRFFSKSREVVALWDEILPDDFIERPRLSRIYYGGQFYAYPLKAIEAFLKLGPVESARCLLSYLEARLRPVPEPKTFADWVSNQFGRRLFEIFFKTYTEKVWGMPCDQISADWAAQRIKGLDLRAAILDGLRRSWRGGRSAAAAQDGPKTLIESFRYPRRGPGQMWEAAAAKITACGGHVRLGRSADSLTFDRSRNLWTVSVRQPDGSREAYTARHVVSTMPLAELATALRPAPLSMLHARALKYRDFITVALIAETGRDFPDNWVYIHDPSVLVGRVQNFRSWSPEMVPDPRYACLGLEYFCFEGDGLWNAPDEELVALATREIDRIGLVQAADIVDACVVRQPKAYPVYDEAYRDNVAAIRLDLETRYPTLHVAGRNGMHKYNNQDHAMMTGILAARNILAGRRAFDPWGVNEDAEYAEAGLSGAQDALASERLVPRRAA
ncbi:MAG: NAD(P)/FAD-dependent oxidoreductase, partial [Methylobacteriaceae bacterium]|nr:NAD(P)/FAD-dependent oxidoreductase [Methylobacteriaceae bacterium]